MSIAKVASIAKIAEELGGGLRIAF